MTDLDFFLKYWTQLVAASLALLWFARLEGRVKRTEEKSIELIKRSDEKLSTVIHMVDKDLETLRQQRHDDQEMLNKQRTADQAENERRWKAATEMLNEVRIDVKKLLSRKDTE